MVNAKNEKSNLSGIAREELSPAGSSSQGKICEVHSGADLVKASSQIR